VTEPQPETRFSIDLPSEIAGGVYADFVSLWHTNDIFTLDFAAVLQAPQPTQDPDTGQTVVVIPTRVVSRVRIPPNQVFEIMKALEAQLSAWERETGQGPAVSPADPPAS
jgi:uncharacterized protein DUF3467